METGIKVRVTKRDVGRTSQYGEVDWDEVGWGVVGLPESPEYSLRGRVPVPTDPTDSVRLLPTPLGLSPDDPLRPSG